MSREIPLTRGYVALVDDEDYERVAALKWCVKEQRSRNTVRRYAVGKRGGKVVSLHRWIMGAARGALVDHRNRNPLDNRKENLRLATYTQNSCNSARDRIVKSSRFRGVTWIGSSGRWRATLKFEGVRVHSGCHLVEVEAARAYDRAAIQYHGEFAVLNFPREEVQS